MEYPIKKVEQLAKKRMRGLFVDGLTQEDLIQEAHYACLKALEKYEKRQARLNTFLSVVIKNCFYTLIKKQNCMCRKTLSFSTPLEKFSYLSHLSHLPFGEKYITGRDEFKAHIKHEYAKLKKEDKNFIFKCAESQDKKSGEVKIHALARKMNTTDFLAKKKLDKLKKRFKGAL